MEFLRLLEGLRTPGLSAFMATITYLGDEAAFLAIALTVYWCVSKRQGYYLFAAGIAGTVANQWLKLVFRIPRPWVLDPGFTIVESARAAAEGYSFPSGHTQNAVATLGCIAVANRQAWVRIPCVALILLIPFSRLYLGVHTPLDVGVGFALAAVPVLALWPVFRYEARFRRSVEPILAALLVYLVVYLLWVNLTRFPADADPVNVASGVKNAWTLFGSVLGLLVSCLVDGRLLHFDERAPLPGQLCKAALGLVLVVGLRAALKPALIALTGGAVQAHALRYFLVVLFAGCVWPMTFPFFARLGAKKQPARDEQAAK